MKRWLLRVSVSALAALLLAMIVGGIAYQTWRTRELEQLRSNSQVVDTARGKVEYALAGNGYPFLMFHGNPGGYDQGIAGPRRYPETFAKRQVIAVSRPGYLRTPLSSGATFEEQADLFAALLDELGIEKVFAFGASGGGYPALQFAMRHPERCHGLILLAPSVHYEPLPAGGYQAAMRYVPVPNVLAWVLSGPLFELVATSFIPDLDLDDAEQVVASRGILKTVLLGFEQRLPGIRNDILQRDFPEIDAWPLETISVPTLLIHGDRDENSVYEGSVHVRSKVPNARLVTYEGADHNMIITRGDEIRVEIDEFMTQVMGGSESEG